jgi:multidrug transporter EmrE-like cation transporter
MKIPNMHYFIWLILSSLFFVIGDFASKKWVSNPNISHMIVLLASYTLSSLVWLPALMQKDSLSVTGILWSIVCMINTILLGVLYFKESLTMIQGIGIGLGFIACILMSL